MLSIPVPSGPGPSPPALRPLSQLQQAMQTLRGGQQPPHIGQFLRGGTPETAAGIEPVVGTQPGCAQGLDSLNVYLMCI
jgi:hypothetical protein